MSLPVPGEAQSTVQRRPSDTVDAKAIRTKLRMSQAEFARAYRIPLATVRDWEQGRRSPGGTARSLLMLIERFPVRVKHTLEGPAPPETK